MGYSTKLTFFQELLFKESELRHGILSGPCPYYSYNSTTSSWLLKSQEVWRLFLMTNSLQIIFCVCPHCSEIPSRFLEVPASLPCLRTMCIGNTTVWSMALEVHESWGSAAAMVQSPCLHNKQEVDCQGPGASLDFFLVPLFFFEDGLAPPVPLLSQGSIINFAGCSGLGFLGNFLPFVVREMVNGQWSRDHCFVVLLFVCLVTRTCSSKELLLLSP